MIENSGLDKVVSGSDGTVAKECASPQLEWKIAAWRG